MTEQNVQSIDPARLSSRSFAARAQRNRELHQIEIQNSIRGLALLQAFYPATKDGAAPEVLKDLATQIKGGRTLREAFGGITTHQQQEIQKRLGSYLEEVLSLAQNQDAGAFWEAALSFGIRLRQNEKLNAALAVFGMLSRDEVPSGIREQAELEVNAVIGKGGPGRRAEFVLSNLAGQSSAYEVVLPMIGASALGQVAGTTVLGRLAGSSSGGFFTRKIGARLGAGAVSWMVEAPLFALGARQLSGKTDTPMGDDIFCAGLGLGAIRLFGFLGNQGFLRLHGINELGAATRLTGLSKFTHAVFPQAAMFAGMYGAHFLEKEWNLRQRMEGETVFTDILAAMVHLQVGANLGGRFLGENLAMFRKEMGLRADIFTKYGDTAKVPLAAPDITSSMNRSLALDGKRAALVTGISPNELGIRHSGPLQIWQNPIMMMSSLNGGNGSSPGPYRQPTRWRAENIIEANEAFEKAEEADRVAIVKSIRGTDLAPIAERAEKGDSKAFLALEIAADFQHPQGNSWLAVLEVSGARGAVDTGKVAELNLAPIAKLAIKGYSQALAALETARSLGHPEAPKILTMVEIFAAYDAYEAGNFDVKDQVRGKDLAPLADLIRQGEPRAVFALRMATFLGNTKSEKILKQADVSGLVKAAKIDPALFSHFLWVQNFHLSNEMEIQKKYAETVTAGANQNQPRDIWSKKRDPDLFEVVKEKFTELRRRGEIKEKAGGDFKKKREILYGQMKVKYEEAKDDLRFETWDKAEEALRMLAEDHKNKAAEAGLLEVFQWRDILTARLNPWEGLDAVVSWAEDGKGKLKEVALEELRNFDVKFLVSEAKQPSVVEDVDGELNTQLSNEKEHINNYKLKWEAIEHLITLGHYGNQAALAARKEFDHYSKAKKLIEKREKGKALYYLGKIFGK